MEWDEGDILIGDGVRLHYYRTGHGPAVVLAHGATDNGRCWDRFAATLAPRYALIAYDARYHGKSDAPAEGGMAGGEDLVALVEGLRLERPALIGHSMGARTVAQAAAARPDLFRCAVLEDPPWWVEPPAGPRPGMQQLFAMSVEEIAAAGQEQNPTWDASEFAAWAESKKQFRPPADWFAGVRNFGTDWRELASQLAIPVLLVCGEVERGAIVAPAVAAEAKSRCRLMEVVSLPAGHNVRREAFEAFRDAVTAFLARHE